MARVLVVEDDVGYRGMLTELLSGAGNLVIEASDGKEALWIIDHEFDIKAPDLVITDFNMAEINGYEFITHLRMLERFSETPILMISGTQKKIDHLLKMSGIEYLSKSAPISEIQAKIQSLLSVAAAASEEDEEEVLGISDSLPGEPPSTYTPPSTEPPPRLPKLPRSLNSPPPAANVVVPPGFRLDMPTQGGSDIVSRSVELSQMIEVSQEEESLDIRERNEEAEANNASDESPIAQMVAEFIEDGLARNASDIHIEPQRAYVQIRARIDGALQRIVRLPASLKDRITARIKVLCDLNITEKRLPQDGQFTYVSAKGPKIKIRVSTLPSAFGEKIVCRILSSSSLSVQLDTLGLSKPNRTLVERVLHSENGLVLTTGPTGSGKTTTLYTMLQTLNHPTRNIVTVEDPIEYQIDGLTQVQVNPKIGYSFEKVLRSFLRQDPNVMLVGEIRDIETAEIALKAAVTGHMVLSTLHTNDAPSAVERLVSMGLPPYLVAAAVRLVIAQRLIRLLCTTCRKEGTLKEAEIALLLPEEAAALSRVWRPGGCEECHNSGYRGRRAIFEIMPVLSDRVRELITQQAGVEELAAATLKEGREPLRQEALRFVQSGLTSPDEALPYVCG